MHRFDLLQRQLENLLLFDCFCFCYEKREWFCLYPGHFTIMEAHDKIRFPGIEKKLFFPRWMSRCCLSKTAALKCAATPLFLKKELSWGGNNRKVVSILATYPLVYETMKTARLCNFTINLKIAMLLRYAWCSVYLSIQNLHPIQKCSSEVQKVRNSMHLKVENSLLVV